MCWAWKVGSQKKLHVLVRKFSERFKLLMDLSGVRFWFYLWAGVSKSPYLGISTPRKNWVHFIKNSNFSRFYKKKLGPFYKKLRCDNFGNWAISTKNALNNQIQRSSMKIYMYIAWNCCLPIADFETTGVQFHENAHFL